MTEPGGDVASAAVTRANGVDGVVAVVTGAAGGIGEALARALAAAGAGHVVVTDLDLPAAIVVAEDLPVPATAARLDVADAADVEALISRVEAAIGPVGLWCGNAGLVRGPGLGAAPDWAASWQVHVQAHVVAARVLVPLMARRGGGRFVLVASAAGLLTSLDSAPYAVTKHATVALAEWLSITYADDGIAVHCVCPQAVRTRLLDPGDVAETVLAAIDREQFLVLPHPEVADHEHRRTADRDRWLAAMTRLRRTLPSVRAAAGHRSR